MKQILLIIVILFLSVNLEGNEISLPGHSLPLYVSTETLVPLTELMDKSLQQNLENILVITDLGEPLYIHLKKRKLINFVINYHDIEIRSVFRPHSSNHYVF